MYKIINPSGNTVNVSALGQWDGTLEVGKGMGSGDPGVGGGSLSPELV